MLGLPHAERRCGKMASVSPQLRAIAPHIGLTRRRAMCAGKGRLSRRPGIFKECACELNVVQLAKAWLPSRHEVKHLKIRLALVGYTNATQHMPVDIFTHNGIGKMLIWHGIVGARYA